MNRILVIGANGQIGSELVGALVDAHGDSNVIAADIALPKLPGPVRYEVLDVLDRRQLGDIVVRHQVKEIYQMAALLSVTGEKAPLKAWTLNIDGLINVLELAREKHLGRVFWPSSIAAFGPHTPALDTPQLTVMDPLTIYGISKQAGERLCEYYFTKFGVDVRSIRYPGVISYKTPPGGGTTDYSIEMFQAAKRCEEYVCFLKPDATLPMIYMPDAVRATLELVHADAGKLRVRTSYNVAATSFSPSELAAAIAKRVPGFKILYRPDFRQSIAESWPKSLDDTYARLDWCWSPSFNLEQLVTDMLQNIPAHWCSASLAGKAA